MRKLITNCAFIAMIAVLPLNAMITQKVERGKIHQTDSEELIVKLSDLTNEMIDDFFEGKASQMIVECTEGVFLPLNLSLEGEFLTIDEISQTIKVLKTCYIKCIEETFFFSSNLKEWKKFQEFFTGMVTFSLNSNENSPKSYVTIELNHKN